MHAFSASVATARRIVALVVLATVAAVALIVSAGFHTSGDSTASPRWNTATHVAGKTVFAKPASPRWN